MAATRVGYFSRESHPIGQTTWQEHAHDQDYRECRKYDNGAVSMTLRWIGRVENPQNYMPGSLPIFRLDIVNYLQDGMLAQDVQSGKTFSSEDEANKFFDDFLLKWTSSHMENGKFVEEGNTLVPPPPPSLDEPNSDVSDIKGIQDDGVGVW